MWNVIKLNNPKEVLDKSMELEIRELLYESQATNLYDIITNEFNRHYEDAKGKNIPLNDNELLKMSFVRAKKMHCNTFTPEYQGYDALFKILKPDCFK